jgi:hypothetical protein
MGLMTVRKNLARMKDVEHSHSEEHETRVEDVKVQFLFHEESITSLDIFYNAKGRSYQDEDTGEIESAQRSLPWYNEGLTTRGRIEGDAIVEGGGDYHEEAEEENLEDQANDNEALAEFLLVFVTIALCEDPTT